MSDRIRIEVTPEIFVEAWPTGRKEARGVLHLFAETDSGFGPQLFPDEARKLAAVLLELADKAEKFSTRGFVGSDE